MKDFLSKKLDEAICLEEYHRERLLYWKRERRRLESELKLLGDMLLTEVNELANRLFSNSE